MVKARTWLGLFVLSFGTIVATASCGSDEATNNSGGNGGASGGGLLAGGASGKGGAQGRAGSVNSLAGATGDGSSSIGLPCMADAECGTGFSCLSASGGDIDGEGPANGMCTMTCSAPADCSAVDMGSTCVNFGTEAAPKGYCVPGCALGGDETSGATKCQGRDDFACADLGSGDGVCLPRCRADLECDQGLFCDNASGLCSKTKHTGDPAGTACSPGAATNTCQGVCLTTSAAGKMPAEGVCVELCVGELGCAYTAKGEPRGICLGALTSPSGYHDIGYCEQTCSCTGDCAVPGDLCRAWVTTDPNEANAAQALGGPGLCFPTVDMSKELSCGEGGAGGTGPTNGSAGEPGVAAGAGGTAGE